MADVIDLSTLKGKGDPKKETPDLEDLTPEEQEAIDKLAEENPAPEGEPVRTAFLVIVGKDGSCGIMPDLDFKVIRDYLPSLDDVHGAVSNIAKDIAVNETAMGTAQAMQQMAQAQMQQLQQAQQNAQIAARLNLPKS